MPVCKYGDCIHTLSQFSRPQEAQQKQLLAYSSDAVVQLARAYKPIIARVTEIMDSRKHPISEGELKFDNFFKESDIEALAKVIWGMNLMGNLLAGAQVVLKNKQQFSQHEFSAVPRISYKEIIRRLKDKQPISKEVFEALTDLEKIKAFTVAGIDSMELLGTIQKSLGTAIQSGSTFMEWRKLINKEYEKAGVELTTPWHLETIYRTNIFSSYMAGKARTIEKFVDYISFLRYVTMRDDVVRPTHAMMEGYTAPPRDPIWQTWFPPNDYNCRCDIEIIWGDKAAGIKSTSMQNIPEPGKGFASNPFSIQTINAVAQKATQLGIPIDIHAAQRDVWIIKQSGIEGSGYEAEADIINWVVKEGNYSLLHEMGHAALRHSVSKIPTIIIQQEIDAWRYALQLIKSSATGARQELIEEALRKIKTYYVANWAELPAYDAATLIQKIQQPIALI